MTFDKIIDTSVSPNKTLRDYVPCRRKSDGVVGHYDKVEEVFYTNASAEGGVTAGPMVQAEWNSSDDNKFKYSDMPLSAQTVGGVCIGGADKPIQ
ncbi:MAG: hypothetical protein J6S51_04345 [Kiritimatiellae bacterium]|nr:hypothetical protein [Kiritimatiellia bacterium]